eukprot:CAMPEP_0177235532 /NCGR_PEP_ID=MMETSP0367-20130122/44975_1 /TAXON_ID=447022 ORGANISM="Scrippsiella hangoei-like, Strain SHHI-4" /NCGR_SAMPLE_ID=MMETSP0367 /ASSEMBLY_ACC=CAM_ASM_000362 /LENGTH=118 /DNA_ID=CAMNT_0018686389 /DNA_START=1 /DNA_END=354 /DNA_ORIENTATION=-
MQCLLKTALANIGSDDLNRRRRRHRSLLTAPADAPTASAAHRPARHAAAAAAVLVATPAFRVRAAARGVKGLHASDVPHPLAEAALHDIGRLRLNQRHGPLALRSNRHVLAGPQAKEA